MFFDDDFIARVDEEPTLGLNDACQKVLNRIDEIDPASDWSDYEHEFLWETSTFISMIISHYELAINIQLPASTSSIQHNCGALFSYVQSVAEETKAHAIDLKIDSYKNRYQGMFKSSFAYEFSQGDLERVQLLINELREQISGLDLLQESHKQRLLRRLEKLQSELHKRVSDLDRFWGLIGDAGVVMGKLGKDAKPIVDRIREIAQISWNTQARTEELPSNSPNPMLDSSEDSL
ncbi:MULTISPECIES: hypothetical protein [Vibrio]|uniref:hypothetical protein n=1 Tax=Vibrio TaxID=662 RepID=UPI00352F1DEE